MRKIKHICILLLAVCGLAACQSERISNDPSLRLSFSCDTVRFDTVFTTIGSSTQQLMVYNPNRNALRIKRITLSNGFAFRINVDGAQPETLHDITLAGHDSMYVFIKAEIDPQNQNDALLTEDNICFQLEQITQQVHLEAYAQDVVKIQTRKHRTDCQNYTFRGEKPYLIFDTVVVNGTLSLEPGARLYFHQGAALVALGSVEANGTPDNPIVLRGDRLDRLFDSVPYAYAAGAWSGLYLQHTEADGPVSYKFSYMDVLSANVGIFATSDATTTLPQLSMQGCRIHNHTLYGLVLQHIDADVTNTEISNCAAYCVYLDGGTHRFVHTTIASYFNFTSIAIQSVAREDVAAVYINNLDKHFATCSSFYNSIITGVRKNQLVVATPMEQYYPGEIVGCYLKTDTLHIPHARDNAYAQDNDTVFVNNFYKYREYIYYDFRLDSVSPACGIGDSLTAVAHPTDRLGVLRTPIPDAGCYQRTGN